MPRFSNHPFLATTLSFFFVIPSAASGSAVRHSRAPLLPAHNLHQSQHEIRGSGADLSRLRRAGRVVEGSAVPRTTPGNRNDNEEVGFSRMIRDDSWRLWAGRSGAHEWRTADPLASLGMTKKGEGRCKERAVAEPRHLSKPIWTALTGTTGQETSANCEMWLNERAYLSLVNARSSPSTFFSNVLG